jgi:hypothetical protein
MRIFKLAVCAAVLAVCWQAHGSLHHALIRADVRKDFALEMTAETPEETGVAFSAAGLLDTTLVVETAGFSPAETDSFADFLRCDSELYRLGFRWIQLGNGEIRAIAPAAPTGHKRRASPARPSQILQAFNA